MTDDMKYTVFYTDENGQLVPNGGKASEHNRDSKVSKHTYRTA